MQDWERIEAFNMEKRPFHLVDHNGGRYSLCLMLDMLPDEFYPYCQEAFNAYAEEIGASTFVSSGRYRFGDGYDWQAAFCQAFKGEADLKKISFDCEASGFFCSCDSLDILEQYGSRFREICTDTAKFTPIVSHGIRQMEQQMKEQEQLMKTVRGQLMANPGAVFHIMTPDGSVTLQPVDTKELLEGTRTTIDIKGVHYAAFELLDQEVVASQRDLFDDNCIRMKTEEADLTMTMEEHKVLGPPEDTPWGEVDSSDQICNGVYYVSTICHGGMMVHESVAEEILSPAARACGSQRAGFYCYEEDCDAAIVYRELMDRGLYEAPVNQYYKEGEFEESLKRSLQLFNPEYWQLRENALAGNSAQSHGEDQKDIHSQVGSDMADQTM